MVLAFCCLIMAKAFNIMARKRLMRARAAHVSSR
jgi:hypothetical protein